MIRPVMEGVGVDVEVRRPSQSTHPHVHTEEVELAMPGVELGGAVERWMKRVLGVRGTSGHSEGRQRRDRENRISMLVQSHIFSLSWLIFKLIRVHFAGSFRSMKTS